MALTPAFDVNLNDIFYRLHEKALEQAKTKMKSPYDESNGYKLVNLGVNYDNQTFRGSGQFAIVFQTGTPVISPDDEAEIQKLKATSLDVIKQYCKYFIGFQESDSIKEDDLKIATVQPDEKDMKVSGFIYPYQVEVAGKIEEQFDATMNNWSVKWPKIFNMAANTASYIAGVPLAAAGAILKAGSNVLNDILDFKLHTTYGDIGLPGAEALKKLNMKAGEWTKQHADKAKEWFKKATTLTVDGNTICSKIKTELDNEFKNNNADVKLEKVNSILNYLQKSGSISTKIIDQFKNFDGWGKKYCVTIRVGENDQNYDSYTVESITDVVRKAINPMYPGNPFGITSKNPFSNVGGVIKIGNFSENGYINKKEKKKEIKRSADAYISESEKIVIANDLYNFVFLTEAIVVEASSSGSSGSGSSSTSGKSDFDKLVDRFSQKILNQTDLTEKLDAFVSSNEIDDDEVASKTDAFSSLSSAIPSIIKTVSLKSDLVKNINAVSNMSISSGNAKTKVDYMSDLFKAYGPEERNIKSIMRILNPYIEKRGGNYNGNTGKDSEYDKYVVAIRWMVFKEDKK